MQTTKGTVDTNISGSVAVKLLRVAKLALVR